MSSKKKLFEADDFNKKKKLFTSTDFDKESEDTITVKHPQNRKNVATEVSEENGKSNSKNWIWIIPGIVAICVIGYFIFSKSGDSTITESEQETEIVEETIVTTDSAANQEATEKVLSTDENEVSNIYNDQEEKEKEAPIITTKNSNIATTTTSSVSNANVSNDVEAEAMKVIRGDYGVGQERKEKLGPHYQPIQSRVNELKREGIF